MVKQRTENGVVDFSVLGAERIGKNAVRFFTECFGLGGSESNRGRIEAVVGCSLGT
jgi:hypothetical protein